MLINQTQSSQSVSQQSSPILKGSIHVPNERTNERSSVNREVTPHLLISFHALLHSTLVPFRYTAVSFPRARRGSTWL